MKSYQIIQRTMADGKIIALPKATIKGTKPGPALAIVAGVHGCEYCGIEATIRLYRDLKPEEMSGTVKMVMCANLPAFRARSMYVCPIDGVNVSRVFPGSSSETYSEFITSTIWEEVVSEAEYVLDLHGGDLIEDLTQYIGYYMTGNQKFDKKIESFALAFGAQNIVAPPISKGPNNFALFEAAIRSGKVGLGSEAGSQGRQDEEDVLFHYEGILNLMRYLVMLPGSPPPPRKDVRLMDEFILIKAGKEGIFYPSVKENDIVEGGQVLGEIRDFTNELLERVISPVRSVVLGIITAASTFEGSTLFGLGRLKK